MNTQPTRIPIKQLVSLDDFNRRRGKEHTHASRAPVPNGIQCPACGHELLDSDPTFVRRTFPPLMHVHCGNGICDYNGERIA